MRLFKRFCVWSFTACFFIVVNALMDKAFGWGSTTELSILHAQFLAYVVTTEVLAHD